MGLFTRKIRRSQSAENPAETKEAPNWLKMLQDNSWELEILISGGAIFSLFQLSDVITDFINQLSYTYSFGGWNVLLYICMLGLKGLTLGFLLHIVLRSFWVSLVSLSSMFQRTDPAKKIKLARPFKTIENASLPDMITKIDKLSSWVMYNTFTLVVVIIGWALLLFSGIFCAFYFETFDLVNLPNVFTVAILLYFLDFILFSLFRKIPWLSYIIYPVFKLFDLITLRFIYQKGFDFVSQNIPRWKIALYYICFMVCTGIFTQASMSARLHQNSIFDYRKYQYSLTKSEQKNSNNYFPTFAYRDKPTDGRIHRPWSQAANIQSEVISDPVLCLFISYYIGYDEFIDKIENPTDRYFANIFEISVDDSIYNNLKFYSIRGNYITNIGIRTYINIGNFNQGSHVLTILNKYVDSKSPRSKLSIPFWIDKEADQSIPVNQLYHSGH